MRFSIIISCDASYGVTKDGSVPWRSLDIGTFFRDKTFGNGKNAVILGRIAYDAIPREHRPLKGRVNIVVSSENIDGVKTAESFVEALRAIPPDIEQAFVAGGVRLYESALEMLYLCDKIYLTQYSQDYRCDKKLEIPTQDRVEIETTTQYKRYEITPNIVHPEQSYLSLLREVHFSRSEYTFARVLTVLSGDALLIPTTSEIRAVAKECIEFTTDLEGSAPRSLFDRTQRVDRTTQNVYTFTTAKVDQKATVYASSSLEILIHIDEINIISLPTVIACWNIWAHSVAQRLSLPLGRMIIVMGMIFYNKKDSKDVEKSLRSIPLPLRSPPAFEQQGSQGEIKSQDEIGPQGEIGSYIGSYTLACLGLPSTS